jgi:VWFA-related protein
LKDLRVEGEGAAVLDGIAQGFRMLAGRGPDRRRVMLVIAERRDRSSKTRLAQVLSQSQLQNTAIYWLHYSPFLTAFTNRPKTKWDRMTEQEKEEKARRSGHKFPDPEDEEVLPPELPPGSLITLFKELKHRAEPDAAGMLAAATGGRTLSFVKRNGLEQAIQAVGDEIHRQYIITFQPPPDASGQFHALRVQVSGRPALQARTRAGYWSLP